MHRRSAPRTAAAVVALLVLFGLAATAGAGVINPDISIIGQPLATWTDDPTNPERKRVRLDAGETELVFDAYLNPYSRGFFTLALGEEGLELEEGFFTLVRGLPLGLNLKGGKYRAGFGKLNPLHGHTYPFAERFRLLSAYLPGEESLNETGLQLSERIPSPGESSVVASIDWLQGDSFRVEREDSGVADDPLAVDPQADRPGESRGAVLGRVSAFAPVGERSGLELGLSGTSGTNNVAAATRTTVWGVDAKLKLWNSERSYLLLQAEALKLDREDATWVEGVGYAAASTDPWGFYLYGDYNFNTRWNVGASYEQFQQPAAEQLTDRAFGLFAGFSLMEETTAFRLGWERYQPDTPADATEDSDAVNTVTLRVIYSMGPHKAHQF